MKIIFISNYFNHHQQPFSDAMYKRLGDDYIFLAAAKVEQERINMGWKASGFPFYVKQINYNNSDDLIKWSEIVAGADVVIGSAFYYKLLTKRVSKNKLTFLYSERLYKSNLRFLKAPLHWYRAVRLSGCYMLCASAFTPFDYSLTGNFIRKFYKWGYFPEVKEYDSVDSLMNMKAEEIGLKHQDVSILWVSRLIGWKHPELPLKVARRLKDKGYQFKLSMIGVGPLEESIKRMIKDNGLEYNIKLLGKMSPEEVRAHMEKSEIFLFTSDRNEGWGAVLNESMNSGCAVVANKKIGSVPYLINDGINGFCYNTVEELTDKVELLMGSHELRERIGRNAYNTMISTWNADKACENFFQLVNSLQKGCTTPIQSGPCSKADIIYGL